MARDAAKRRGSPAGQAAAAERFAAAERASDGALDWELEIDGGMVPTTDGWRELKVATLALRPRGERATSADWATRTLPRPTARLSFAALGEAEDFGAECRTRAAALGLRAAGEVTVVADGAAWIWGLADREFPGSAGLLDVFHGLGRLADAAKALHGEGTAAAAAWLDAARRRLLADGWWGVLETVGLALAESDTPARRETLDGVLAYFAKHTEHLAYAARLAAGQTIGSGLIEGTIKVVAGGRLKQTGARWLVRNVTPMAELVCLRQSDDWDAYWAKAPLTVAL